ncbi:MAG: BPSS1780 family membrane protein [Burkholderiales bacterium]
MSTPNPYAAPRAAVADAVSPQQGNFVPGGRGVPAGNGWSWIAEGWSLFKRQPGMWIAIVVVLFVISLVAAFIPFIGSIATMVLFPVFTAGLMLGCQAQAEGGRLEFGHLFAGFRDRVGPLAAVGGIYLGATIVIALVVGIVTGVGMFSMMSGGEVDPAAAAGALAGLALAGLVMLALMIPILMAIWFAPALVVFHERGAVEAMKESFSGCLRNIVPFLVYGLVTLVLAILASIPIALGWLVLGPVLAASIYTAYRDIYFTS